VNLSGKKSDKEHQYGHERMECVSSIILSGLLLATGIGIGMNGIENIIKESNRFTAILTPDTFIATLCSHAGSSFLAVVLLFVLSDIAVMFNFFVCSITRTS
jgi:divalent metal cation (Fe/Co/Zn/Cd) transporter